VTNPPLPYNLTQDQVRAGNEFMKMYPGGTTTTENLMNYANKQGWNSTTLDNLSSYLGNQTAAKPGNQALELAGTVNWGDSPTTGILSPIQQQQQQQGLTLADLDNWWKQQQAAQQNGVGTNPNSLGQLFPRTNWGNYQTSNRGGRYFDATSGKYQGLGNIAQTQTASL
jgi:hypothetical protein